MLDIEIIHVLQINTNVQSVSYEFAQLYTCTHIKTSPCDSLIKCYELRSLLAISIKLYLDREKYKNTYYYMIKFLNVFHDKTQWING